MCSFFVERAELTRRRVSGAASFETKLQSNCFFALRCAATTAGDGRATWCSFELREAAAPVGVEATVSVERGRAARLVSGRCRVDGLESRAVVSAWSRTYDTTERNNNVVLSIVLESQKRTRSFRSSICCRVKEILTSSNSAVSASNCCSATSRSKSIFRS
eukprot:SAG31_NODE_277_length_18641_cov_21.357944_2_plen_161_part_00